MNFARLSLIIIGLIALATAGVLTHSALSVKQWQSAQGQLTSLYTRNISSPTVGGANDWGPDHVFARYTYVFEGKRHEGSTVAILDSLYLPGGLLDRLETGQVEVHVNPKNASQSVIFKRFPSEALFILFSFAGLFLCLGACLPWLVVQALHLLHPANSWPSGGA